MPSQPLIGLMAVSALVLGGCANQHTYDAPKALIPEAVQYETAHFDASLWSAFQSTDLQHLLTLAYQENTDLKIAAKRMELARLAIRQTQAGNGISASAGVSASQSWASDTGEYSNSESLSFSARYEWDIWGKLATQEDQEKLNALTSQWDVEAAQLSLSATVIKQYLAYLSLLERQDFAGQNLASAQESYALYEMQQSLGLTSASDLLKQQSTVLSLEEKMASFDRQIAAQLRAINLLIGTQTWQPSEPRLRLKDIQIPHVALNQPMILIQQRPDLKAAEASVRQAFLSKVELDQSRWPNLSISVGLRPSDLYNLAERWTLSLAESLSFTLYDGGQRQMDETKAEINEEIARLQYQQTVITALVEVQDTLSDYEDTLSSYQYKQRSRDNLAQQLDLAQLEWEEGVGVKADVISAQRSLFSADETLISTKESLLNAVIAVYQANGTAPQQALP